MKKFLKFSALALLLCSAAAFVSCSNGDDDNGSSPSSGSQTSGGSTSTSSNANDGTVTWAMSNSADDVTEYELYVEDSSSSSAGSTSGSQTSGDSITSISQVENIRFGTGVSGKAIFKYYTVLPGNKVRYEQTKFGSYTSDVTWDYTAETVSAGKIKLTLSNGVQKVEGAAYGNDPITFDFSTGADTPTLTSTYYERGVPVESTGQFTRVYSGIKNVIGNAFVHAVSGKSISSSYNFSDDGTVKYKLIKYSKLNEYGHYKYQITAWNVLTDEEVTATDSDTKILAFDKASLAHDLNTYAVHFVYAETETYTLEANDYSQGYGTSTKTTYKNVTAGDEPDAPYIFIKLVGDGVAKINVVKAIAITATE